MSEKGSKTIKDYRVEVSDASIILSTARFLSQGNDKVVTVLVEGKNDLIFFKRYYNSDKVVFKYAEGKRKIEEIYVKYCKSMRTSYKYIYFCVDIDWDIILELELKKEFIYNVYHPEIKQLYFNDLEIFLINKVNLDKILCTYGIMDVDIQKLLFELEQSSRIVGKFRVADQEMRLLHQQSYIPSNFLQNLKIVSACFDEDVVLINENKLKDLLQKDFQQQLQNQYWDQFLQIAQNKSDIYKECWSLSRGHDVTEILFVYIKDRYRSKMVMNKDYLEKDLLKTIEDKFFVQTSLYHVLLEDGYDCNLPQNNL